MTDHTHSDSPQQGVTPRPETMLQVKIQQLSAAQHESSAWQAAYLDLQSSVEEILEFRDERIRELEAELISRSTPTEKD